MAGASARNHAVTVAAGADVKRLLADDSISTEGKTAILDERERELREELLSGRTAARAAARDDADAYHLLNEVLGALAYLRGEDGNR